MSKSPPFKVPWFRWTLFALLVAGGLALAFWLGPESAPVVRPGGALP